MLHIRDVEISDAHWIAILLIDGVKKKHFSNIDEEQAYKIVQEVTKNDQIKFRIFRNEEIIEYIRTIKIYVAELNGIPASFLLCADDHDGMELHLAATKYEFRHKGCFSKLVLHAISQCHVSKNIYVRCYQNSIDAISRLIKLGFIVRVPDNNPIELIFNNLEKDSIFRSIVQKIALFWKQ